MSETTHTPGPWRLDEQPAAFGLTPIRTDGRVIARVELSDEADEANAHLIAAAPDLCAIAEMVVFLCDSGNQEHAKLALMENSPLVDEARMALAKARGK